MFRAFLLLGAVTAAAMGCGSSTGECATGTVRHGYACYPTDPEDRVPPVVTVDPPVRTPQVGNVRLTTNEPATIYYAADGSLATQLSRSERDQVVIPDVADNAIVSFFAVDLNGNVSPVQSIAWQIDRNGPGTPTSFKLTLAGTMRTLTWVPPDDSQLQGVLVARVDGVLNWSPERGKKYNVGDDLAPGVKAVSIVATGSAAELSEDVATHTVGLVRYAAWAFDDIYNYGSPANAYATETLPAQTASVTVASATGVVTVGTQPANLAITGTATLDGSDLTVNLDIMNNTSRVLFAPKLLLTTPPSIGTVSNSDGTFDTFDYRALGGAILPATKVSVALELSGVTSGDEVVLGLEVRNGPLVVAGEWDDNAGSAVDEATGQVVVDFKPGTAGPRDNSSMHGGGLSVDGKLVMGSRNSSEMITIDVATGQRTMVKKLSEGKSHVPRLTVDASGGTGYALVAPSHQYAARYEGLPTELVVFDTATLVETARVDVGISRNRSIEVSQDGKRLAVATGLPTGIYVIELGDLTVRLIPTPFTASNASFLADNASMVVTSKEQVAVIKLDDASVTKSFQISGSGKSFTGAFGPDGRYWLGMESKVFAIDLTTDAYESFDYDAGILHVYGNKIYVCGEGNNPVYRLDTSGVDDMSFQFSDSAYGHWMGHSPF